MNGVYDVIIIGGGIMGCSTAYELARRGLEVALLDTEAIRELVPGLETTDLVAAAYEPESG